jgi:hypothetical protein
MAIARSVDVKSLNGQLYNLPVSQNPSHPNLLLLDNSNNKQPLIENWLPFTSFRKSARCIHALRRRTYRAASP